MSASGDPRSVDPDAEEREVARAAGLRYVSADAPGWVRRPCGRGFTYTDERGKTLRGSRRERAEALVIPPAWTEVWICPDEAGHLLATGRDDAGRKQYLYHPVWREIRDRQKFMRLSRFGQRLTRLRKQVEHDLRCPEPTLARAAAAAVRLMDTALVRVGNDVYAEDQETFGVTTLEARHVEVAGDVVELAYTGKGDIERHHVIEGDTVLARAVRDCLRLDNPQVLCGRNDTRVIDLTSDHVNDYVARHTNLPCSAKDFRTWGGSVVATETLADVAPPADEDDQRAAVDAAAEALGNTRAVARSSYVAPAVLQTAETGSLHAAWKRSRRTDWMTRAERTCLKILRQTE